MASLVRRFEAAESFSYFRNEKKKMAEEIESFVTKFKSLWTSGHQARLTLNSRNGRVWINLQVGLKCPQPHHGVHDHQHPGLGNAHQRRKIRRAAARASKEAEEVIEAATTVDPVSEAVEDTANHNVAGATAKEVSTKNKDLNLVENFIETIRDEFCCDTDYDKPNVSKETNAILVKTILVSPDCQTGWKDSYITKLISDKLTAVDLKVKSFQINRSRGSFTSCLVQIEPVTRKKTHVA